MAQAEGVTIETLALDLEQNTQEENWVCDECGRENDSGSQECARCSLERNELTKSTEPNPLESMGTFGLVHFARYLHRPLFPLLANLVAPGGFIFYSTFMHPSHGRPKKERYGLLRLVSRLIITLAGHSDGKSAAKYPISAMLFFKSLMTDWMAIPEHISCKVYIFD